MSQPVIPFFSLRTVHEAIHEEVQAAIARVYEADWFVLGAKVMQFERAYSLFNEVQQTVGVGNGLDALALALRALGIGPGDEVLVPANTYVATWLAVSHVGAVPVPVEPEYATSNLDPSRLAAAITPRTRAVMPVHLYGQPCRMTEIMALANHYGLLVIEDNAQAHGAKLAGQLTGSFGQASGTSFYPTKNLGALGDAGAVTTNDAAVANRVRQLRNYGSLHKNQHELLGYNSRLDELQAAVLQVKLQYLPQWTAQRRELAAWYNQYLADIPGLRLPMVIQGAEPVWHLYVVHTSQRTALQHYLTARGINTQIHYPVPPHRQPAYTQLHLRGKLPIAEELAATCLSLPLWPGMTEQLVMQIAGTIRQFYEGIRQARR